MRVRIIKPYRTITHYTNGDSLRAELKAIGAVFTERPVFSNFYGVEFSIMKPKGRGARLKMRLIDRL